MRRIGTLNHGGELRIADPGLNAGGADGSRADANFDDIGAGEDQLFAHFTGDHVPGDDSFAAGFARLRHELYKVLRVAVGDVDTQNSAVGSERGSAGFFEIRIGRAGGNHHMLEYVCGCATGKRQPFFSGVVLMYRGQNTKVASALAMLKVPTVSMLAAIIGTPDQSGLNV